jgi:recombinational DNA repair protein RecT
MAEKNQSEGEFFAVVATGRRGVESMLQTMGPEIAAIAAPNVGKSFETWKARALVEIANRDELRDVLQTKAGIFSVYKALAKAATNGLQIGGQFPHAYLVPMGGRAQLVTTAEGLAFASTHGPGAVLRHVPKLERVYEKDRFHVDMAAGAVKHDFDAFGDRGKIAGYYMLLEYLDGHREVSTVTRADVLDIAAKYGNQKSPAYGKSPEAMYDKTASKQLLKKPAKEAEGLAMLLSLDEYEAPEARPAPSRDVTERMSARLDDAVEGFKVEQVPEEEPAEEKQSEGEVF